MTTYTVTAGNIAAHQKTLVANTEDIVDFGYAVGGVRIIIDAAAAGGAPLYVTGDDTTATVAGANTFELAAVVGAEEVLELNDKVGKVHLISAGAHTYTVERA